MLFPHVLIFWPVSIIWVLPPEVNRARHLSFFKQGQNSKVQRVSLLWFSFWRAASFLGDGCWERWLPFGETTLTRRVWPYTCRLHSNPNIHVKDTHGCYHEGYSLIGDMPSSMGKISFFVFMNIIYYRSLCMGHGKLSEKFGFITLHDLSRFSFLSYPAVPGFRSHQQGWASLFLFICFRITVPSRFPRCEPHWLHNSAYL